MNNLIISSVAALTLGACSSAQLQKANTDIAPVLAAVAQSAADSYVNTGKVDTKAVAAAALNGVASIAQSYVGSSVDAKAIASTLAAGAGTSSGETKLGQAIVSQLPVGQITQATVNQIFTAAEKAAK